MKGGLRFPFERAIVFCGSAVFLTVNCEELDGVYLMHQVCLSVSINSGIPFTDIKEAKS